MWLFQRWRKSQTMTKSQKKRRWRQKKWRNGRQVRPLLGRSSWAWGFVSNLHWRFVVPNSSLVFFAVHPLKTPLLVDDQIFKEYTVYNPISWGLILIKSIMEINGLPGEDGRRRVLLACWNMSYSPSAGARLLSARGMACFMRNPMVDYRYC